MTNLECCSGIQAEQVRNMLSESGQDEDLVTRLTNLERTSSRIEEMLEKMCSENEQKADTYKGDTQ